MSSEVLSPVMLSLVPNIAVDLLDYEQELEKHVIRDTPHPKRLIRAYSSIIM